MIFQCTIERDGNTQMFLDRFEYVFKPSPELTGNDVDKVCVVASRSHQEKFRNTEGFKEWHPKPDNNGTVEDGHHVKRRSRSPADNL